MKEIYVISFLEENRWPPPQPLLKKSILYILETSKTNIQNYIAIFSEEDPLYRTHNSEIGNIRFLDCDHVTAKYL